MTGLARPARALLSAAALVSLTACASEQPRGQREGMSAATSSPTPTASPTPSTSEKTEANLRACRDLAVIKLQHGGLLQQAIDGGGYLAPSAAGLTIRIAASDAVAGSADLPDGRIGDAAAAAFRASRGIQDAGGQPFFSVQTAGDLLAAVDQGVDRLRFRGHSVWRAARSVGSSSYGFDSPQLH